jgi:hypothetical protein
MSEEHWWPAFDGSVRSIVSGEGERPSLYVLTREASKDDDSPDNSDTYTEVDSDSDDGRGWSIQRWDPSAPAFLTPLIDLPASKHRP